MASMTDVTAPLPSTPAARRLCVLGMAMAAACAPHPPVIESGGVGPVTIGDPQEAIEAAYPEDRRRLVDLRLEGMPAPAIELMPPGTGRRDALVAELAERDGTWRAYRLQVRDPLITTERGVGVGDTVGELRAHHATGRLIGGEGNVGIRVEALSATFLLARDRVRPSWWHTSDAAQVPDDVTIRRILLTCTPDDCPKARAASGG